MVGEALAGLGALKTAFDIAKGLKDIDDTARRNAAVIELQERILAGQEAQSALIKRVDDLEKEVAGFEKWEAEKEKYQLQEVYTQNFAYAIKPDARGAEPPHLICASCYEIRRKSILQQASSVHMQCPVCNSRVQVKPPKEARSSYSPRWP